MPKSLTDKTISGLNWNFISNYSNAIISLAVGVVLARLLTPKDFGLIGMVVVFTGLADLFATLGMAQSIIRIKGLTENHIRVATTLTIISSILIFFLFYFIAPVIASFYNEQRLISIIRVLSILFLIKGINTVSYGQLQKNLDFKSIMVISIGSSISYGVMSSILAIFGLGVWSLVYGKITSAFVALFFTSKKYPANLKFLLSKKELRQLAGFGSGVSLSRIIQYGASNVDYLVIGKFLNPYQLGLYTKAFHMMTDTITKITGGIYTVLFPAFAAVQNEPEKLRKAYFRVIRTLSYFVFPVFATMIVTAEYIIKGLYGVTWAGTITAFQILAVGGILRLTTIYSGSIAHATGRVFKEARQQFGYFLILGGCALFAVRFGIEGVAVAVLIALFWKFFVQCGLAIQIVKSSWRQFFIELIPGLTNLFVMVLVNLILVFLLDKFFLNKLYEIKLIAIVIINVIVFLLAVVFVPYSIKGDTIYWLIEKYKKYIPSKFLQFYFAFNSQK